MTKTRLGMRWSVGLTALSLAAGLAGPVSAQSTTASTVDDVIVTARKREESLQAVPISVAAYSEEALARQGITDIAQLARAVPGVSIQDGGPGYRSVFVRGVTSERGNSPTTAFYYDETFVPPGGVVQTVIEPIYFDVQRIEVLRGPQGTVFGGSAMGGAIRVLPNAPDASAGLGGALGADLSSTEDGGVNWTASGFVNLPIVADTLALRIAGSARRDEGYIDELTGTFTGADRQASGPSPGARTSTTWTSPMCASPWPIRRTTG
jgi:iron complex outermembrane receptor protein